MPLPPLGAAGAFVPMGWLMGVNAGSTIPASFWQGNRLFGATVGLVVSVTRVSARHQTAQGLELDLETTASPLAHPAKLVITPEATGGWRLQLTPPDNLPLVAASIIGFSSPASEGLYGLGARKDQFNQRGLLRNVWVEQQNTGSGPLMPITNADPTGLLGPEYTFPNGAQAAYYVTSALFGSRGWSVWTDNTELAQLDLASSQADAIRWSTLSPTLTFHIAGGGMEQASRSYTAAQGRAPAPPSYVYLPWMDVINQGEGDAAPNGQGFTGGARVKADVQKVVQMTQQLDIPLGVIGMEGWQSVPDIATFARGLRDQGYHLAAYWNFFTSPPSGAPYQEAENQNLLVKTALGTDYPVLTNRQNISYIIDFTKPSSDDYWAQQLRRSMDLGFEAFMHDFGELTTEGMVFDNGEPLNTVHNLYPVLYHRAARLAVNEYAATHSGFQPFFYVRAGDNGVSASTPGVFPGDESTDWSAASGIGSVIPAMLNLSLTGSYAFTTDVGGYLDLITPRTTKELLIRWSQLAAFTPILRLHNSTYHKSVYPWDFDDETVSIFRRYARAKVKLAAMVDAYVRRAAAAGDIGPVRPLVLVDQSVAARDCKDEWLLGNDLLVAPVIEQGAIHRKVYLPIGHRWQQVAVADDGSLTVQGESFEGGQSITVPVTIADIPLFKRL